MGACPIIKHYLNKHCVKYTVYSVYIMAVYLMRTLHIPGVRINWTSNPYASIVQHTDMTDCIPVIF